MFTYQGEFDVFEAVIIGGLSIRKAAARFNISCKYVQRIKRDGVKFLNSVGLNPSYLTNHDAIKYLINKNKNNAITGFKRDLCTLKGGQLPT